MKRLLILLLTLSLSTVFIFIPDTEPKDYFLFSDQKLTLATHLFFLFEHIILILLGIAVYMDSTKHKAALIVYIALQSVDTLIYLLAYGNFRFPNIPITWNFVKVLIFTIAVVREHEKH